MAGKKHRRGGQGRKGPAHGGQAAKGQAQQGQARGRRAEGPTEIPARGWRDIFYRVFQEISNDRVLLVAAGVTFYLLLALAPTLAAFVSIYGLFFDPATVQEQMQALSGVLPGGAISIIQDQLSSVSSTGGGALGFAFALSLVLALWSANAGMKSLFEAMNVAYDETEERGFVRLTLVTMAMTVGTLVAVIGLLAANVAYSALAAMTGLEEALPPSVVTAATAAIGLVALIVFMTLLYRFGPSRERPRWAWITPGAVIAGLGIVVVSVAFSFYVSNFGTYNETYGSLGAIIGFLTWLWLTITVLILGGEINSEMEHQTARDTTTGATRPRGQRGAVMADEVAAGYGQDAARVSHGTGVGADGGPDGGAGGRAEDRPGLGLLLGAAALRAVFRRDRDAPGQDR